MTSFFDITITFSICYKSANLSVCAKHEFSEWVCIMLYNAHLTVHKITALSKHNQYIFNISLEWSCTNYMCHENNTTTWQLTLECNSFLFNWKLIDLLTFVKMLCEINKFKVVCHFVPSCINLGVVTAASVIATILTLWPNWPGPQAIIIWGV